MRILLKTVYEIEVGKIVGRNTRDAYSDAILPVQENHFLTPVTDDVSPESSPLGIDSDIAVVADFGKLHLSSLKEILDIDVIVAVTGLHYLTVRFVVPPDSFAGILAVITLDEVALCIIDLAHRGPHLPSQVRAVYVHALTSPHVTDGRQIPLLDELARPCIVEHLAQHITCVLLYGKGFQSGAFGVYVTGAEPVTMCNAGIEERTSVMVHRIATLYHLVTAVTIYVPYPYLVEGGPSRRPVEEFLQGPGLAAGEIVGYTYIIIMVVAGRASDVPLHDHTGMYPVEVAYTHVTHVLVVLVTHQLCTVRAVIVLVVGLFYAGLFGTCHTIDDRDVARCIATGLCLIVNDTVTIRVTRGVSHDETPEVLLLRIPELCAVRRLDDDFSLPVAVHVSHRNHVVLSCTAEFVGTEFHGPEVLPVAQIPLYIAVKGIAVCLAVDHIVQFSITIQVDGPHVGGVELCRCKG